MTTFEKTGAANIAVEATTNAAAAKPVTYLSDLLKRCSAETAINNKSSAKVAGSGNACLEQIATACDELAEQYEQYKVSFGDRSDAALWQVLQNVYVFVLSIDADKGNGKLKKEELVKQLKARGYKKANVNNSTALLLVKYVFADQAKQTHSNYANAMSRAQGLGIASDEFAAFLKKNGGIMKMLETYFEVNEQGEVNAVVTAPANKAAEAAKVDAQERLQAFRRALIAMSGEMANEVACNDVTDWVPADERKAEVKEKDPDNAKYKRGSFVFFVAVEGDEPGNYKLVQGFSAARDLEDKLIAQMLPNVKATVDELRAVAQHCEQAQGLFDDGEGTAI
jgi:hypothetical protein